MALIVSSKADDDSSNAIDRTPSLRPRGSSKSKKKKSSKKKKKSKNSKKVDKKSNKQNDENSNTERHRLQLLYSQLSTLKLPYKKRMESLKTCTDILTNPNCNTFTIKFAINGFKKIFVQQLKDKKFEIHQQLYNILAIFINRHYKVYKLKNVIFLSLLLDHIKHINNENEQIALDEMINCIISKIITKDDKQCIAVLNEFFQNGTNSKHKTIKQKSWQFLHIALDQKYNKNNAKMSKKVLNCLENGIKHHLNDKTDKIAQENCFKILFFVSNQNEMDCFHKMYTKYLNDASKKKYEKLYGSTKRRSSSLRVSVNGMDREKRSSFVGQYNMSPKRMSVNNIKRRDSLEKIKQEKIEKKRKKKKKKKGKKKKESVEKIKENILADISSTNGSQSKLKDLYNSSKKAKKKEKKKKKKSEKNVAVVSEEKDDKHQRIKHTNLDILNLGFEDLNDPNLSPVPTEIDEQKSEKLENQNDEYANFPIEFLQNEECKIDGPLSEYLCAESGIKSRKFLSILSRLNDEINIYEDTFQSIDYSKPIPNCVIFDYDNEEECKLNQLSYNLIGCLWTENGESGCEPVSNYLLAQCDEIILNALSVYNQSISCGNVYHARVVLESLLITHPKALMNALTNNENVTIQYMLKNALFRSIHQGNVDSFFLDLLCYVPTQDMSEEIIPCKIEIIQLLKKWEFMQYLLKISINTDNDDLIATKYGTFFIDLVARCASIKECALLFEDCENLIVDSFVNALLDEDGLRSTWHRVSCGQILISFMDICSRPTIVDPAAAQMADNIEMESVSNCLFPMFGTCLNRLHTHIPKLCDIVIDYKSEFEAKGGIKLSSGIIHKPFGQIRAHCMEMLTLSADYAQFECGEVLGKMPISFWSQLVDIALLHPNNNLFLCHFRRLIHLSMMFRRRILKYLIVERKMIDRFLEYYMDTKEKSALHSYVLQMTCDIWMHENEQEDVLDEL